MPKNKRPVPRKQSPSVRPQHEEEEELQAQAMVELAMLVAELEAGKPDESDEFDDLPDDAAPDEAPGMKSEELSRLIRNALRKKKDEVLYGALQRALFIDLPAFELLRERIEEAAGIVLLHREGEADIEVNAFALPVFVHSTGGLQAAGDFADGDAFEALVDSFKQAGLESPDARVVLLSHAYDLGEVVKITYSQLQEMVRDAAASMTEKKLVPRPALERSMSGWTAMTFAPQDKAVEMRFLLGFTLKRTDDPFYIVPEDEDAADAYFDARMTRFEAWSESAAPLVRRCLALAPDTLELFFQYQNLFYGAVSQAVSEFDMMQVMAALRAALEDQALAAGQVNAVIGPLATQDDVVVRIELFDDAGTLVARADKPVEPGTAAGLDVDDIADALGTIGIGRVALCSGYGDDGAPVAPMPLRRATA